MRLGGPVAYDGHDAASWVAELQRLGYSAAFWPLDDKAGEADVRAHVQAAGRAGIVIAEVGAWSNPLSPDEPTRRAGLAFCQERLATADRVGASCCVNIAGSRGAQWDGHHPANFTRETFDLIVESVRAIIDAVRPTRTTYALETMPWMYPDSAESYVQLIQAIDRPRFAVHLDPVNLICSPQRYYSSGDVIRECFRLLGPHIVSCHAKDIALSGRLTVHLDEVIAGRGGLDYRAYLEELSRLPPDTPLMLEHLHTAEEYAEAAAYVRGVAREAGVSFVPPGEALSG